MKGSEYISWIGSAPDVQLVDMELAFFRSLV